MSTEPNARAGAPVKAVLANALTLPNQMAAAVDHSPQVISPSALRVSHGQATLKGRFHANEDRVSVTALPQTPAGCLVLLCDGHDGVACATFVQARFPRDVVSGTGDAGAALIDAFAQVEGAWTAHVRSARAHGGARVGGGISSGACVTAVLVRGAHITAANVGDARAILRRADGSIAVLTEDHRCSNPGERERLLRLGGPGAIRNGRAVGVLEPTRTIGDLEEKIVAGPGVISSVPSVAVVELESGDVGPAPPPAAATEGSPVTTPPAAPSAAVAPASAALSLSARGVKGGPGLPSSSRGGGATGRAGGSVAARAALSATLSSLGFGGAWPGATSAAAAYGGGAGGLSRSRGRASAPLPPALTVAQATVTARSSRACFVVAASDGVWDVLPSGAAAAVVAHVLETRRDPAAAAAELVALAQRLGSADDITAAVVWIQDEGRGQQQQQRKLIAEGAEPPAAAAAS